MYTVFACQQVRVLGFLVVAVGVTDRNGPREE